MNFFTESVDAALWSSRTFDDPSYDDDPTAAAESRAPVSVEQHVNELAPAHLIISASSAADAALEAICPASTRTPLATLSGAGVSPRTIHLSTGGPLDGCVVLRATGVSDDRAANWASAALKAFGNPRIVVATSTSRAQMHGQNEIGVRVLATRPVEIEGSSALLEPNFVAGAAAAVVAEAAWGDREAVCLVGVTERANFELDEVLALANATCQAVSTLGGSAVMSDEVRERAREVAKKSAVLAHDSIYL